MTITLKVRSHVNQYSVHSAYIKIFSTVPALSPHSALTSITNSKHKTGQLRSLVGVAVFDRKPLKTSRPVGRDPTRRGRALAGQAGSRDTRADGDGSPLPPAPVRGAGGVGLRAAARYRAGKAREMKLRQTRHRARPPRGRPDGGGGVVPPRSSPSPSSAPATRDRSYRHA
jgi:hypothetical protein